MVGYSDRFWDVVCAFVPLAYLFFIINTILLLLVIYAWYFGAADSASSAMVYVDAVLVGANFLALHHIISRCGSRGPS